MLTYRYSLLVNDAHGKQAKQVLCSVAVICRLQEAAMSTSTVDILEYSSSRLPVCAMQRTFGFSSPLAYAGGVESNGKIRHASFSHYGNGSPALIVNQFLIICFAHVCKAQGDKKKGDRRRLFDTSAPKFYFLSFGTNFQIRNPATAIPRAYNHTPVISFPLFS